MTQDSSAGLPLRQKIFITVTVVTGLFIIVAYYTGLLNYKSLYWLIWSYGFAVPLVLVTQNTLCDLNHKDIFNIWLTIAFTFLVVYICCRSSSTTVAGLSQDAIEKGLRRSLAKTATFSFKALPIFLICYWILNKILKKKTGLYIINTFKLFRPYNNVAQRRIYASDILINIFLTVVIFIAVIIKT